MEDPDGNGSDYGNIVIAGTESLGSSIEYYSLSVDKDPNHPASLNAIEAYVKDNNFNNLNIKMTAVEDATSKTLKVTSPAGDSK